MKEYTRRIEFLKNTIDTEKMVYAYWLLTQYVLLVISLFSITLFRILFMRKLLLVNRLHLHI